MLHKGQSSRSSFVCILLLWTTEWEPRIVRVQTPLVLQINRYLLSFLLRRMVQVGLVPKCLSGRLVDGRRERDRKKGGNYLRSSWLLELFEEQPPFSHRVLPKTICCLSNAISFRHCSIMQINWEKCIRIIVQWVCPILRELKPKWDLWSYWWNEPGNFLLWLLREWSSYYEVALELSWVAPTLTQLHRPAQMLITFLTRAGNVFLDIGRGIHTWFIT